MQRLGMLALLLISVGCGANTETTVAPPMSPEEIEEMDAAGQKASEDYAEAMKGVRQY